MKKKSIIIGTELFSGSWGEKFNKKKIDEIFYYSLSRGINEIDTAPSYGKNNKVEKLIGDCIKGSRKKFIISSKFSNKIIGTGPTQSKKRIDLVKRSLDKSLSALKTDFIDNFFFHSGTNKEFFHDDMWKFLNEMKSKKVIRRLGLSIKHNLVKKNSNHQLKSAKYYGITIISTVLNLFSKEALKFVVPFCRNENLKIFGRMPLAKGILSGKYNEVSNFKKKDPRFKYKKITLKILKFVKNKNVNTKTSIQWALNHSDKIIIGFKNLNQIENISEIIKKYE